ncbi:hypothetical protein AMECASPLE_024948 [Ameca splendens]|uniref:Uncharacterized protein n=1 Tax=Ameca splendens TaxID=208324 RepID=A0ABV0XTL3_9TELE
MAYDQWCSRGSNPGWPRGTLFPSTLASCSSLSARKERDLSVKSTLLIKEYFFSRDEGKKGEREREREREKERQTTPMGQGCTHGRVSALCQPKEIHQRERERDWEREKEMEREVKRKAEGGFTGWRLALEN